MTFGQHTLARRRRDQRAIQPFNQAAQLRAGAARAAAGNDERTRGALEQTHGGVDYAEVRLRQQGCMRETLRLQVGRLGQQVERNFQIRRTRPARAQRVQAQPQVIAHVRRAAGTARDAEHARRERGLVVEFVQHAPLLGERSAHRRARDHQQRHRIGIRLRHGGHDVGEARPRDHEGGRRAAAQARESIRSKTGALFVPHQHVADLRRSQTAIQFQVVHAGNAEHGVDIVGSQ